MENVKLYIRYRYSSFKTIGLKNSLVYLTVVVLLVACTHSSSPTPPTPPPVYPPTLKSYTKKMAGTRHWNGTHKYVHSVPYPIPHDTVEYYTVDDSLITIVVIDDSTIRIDQANTTLKYFRTIDSLDYIVFLGTDPTYPKANSILIYYYYTKDSMTDSTDKANTYAFYYDYLKTP